MLLSASLAQISVSNWSSLDDESKLNLADLIFENVPKNYLFKLAMKICNAQARDVEVDSFVAELVENEDENQIILEFQRKKKQVDEVGVEEKVVEPLPLSPSSVSGEEEIEEKEEVPKNSFEDMLNQLLSQSAPQNPIQPQQQQQNPPPHIQPPPPKRQKTKTHDSDLLTKKQISPIDGSTLVTYHCRFCNHFTKRKRDLMDHERKHMPYNTFACHLCPYEAKQLRTMKNHIYKIHQEKFCGEKVRVLRSDRDIGVYALAKGILSGESNKIDCLNFEGDPGTSTSASNLMVQPTMDTEKEMSIKNLIDILKN